MPEPVLSKIRIFVTSKKLSEWLAENHATESELWIKTFKKYSGIQSVTWNDVVIEV